MSARRPALTLVDRQTAVPRIVARGIHKTFGDREVLHGISMSARDGDVVTLIGSSGSGKSTFLRCINLLEIPDQGDIEIDGEALHFDSSKSAGGLQAKQIRRVRAKLGMVFQDFQLWAHMTVLENLTAAPIHVLGIPRREAEDRARLLLERVGIGDKARFYPSELSGGQQQRAAIARALAIEPRAILLDEPTSALDPELVGEVLRVIRNLAEAGTTMVLVTHELRFAREISTRVLFLHGGKVAEEGPPEEVLGQPRSEVCRRFVQSEFGAG
jgi:ABC-type histidine transport system ATPase subunit